MKTKGTTDWQRPQCQSISKECGGGFPTVSLRDEGEVNKCGSWGGRSFSFHVVTRQWATFSCPRLRQARSGILVPLRFILAV